MPPSLNFVRAAMAKCEIIVALTSPIHAMLTAGKLTLTCDSLSLSTTAKPTP